MSDEELTAEERKALRENLTEEVGPVPLDLQRASHLRPRANVRLERRFAATAKSLSLNLQGKLPHSPAIQSATPELVGPGELASLLADLAVVACYTTPDGQPIGVAGVDGDFAFWFIEHAYGAHLPADEVKVHRPERSHLTDLEHETLRPIVELMAGTARGELLDAKDGRVSIQFTRHGMKPEVPSIEECTLWRGELTCGAFYVVAYPAFVSRITGGQADAIAQESQTWLRSHVLKAHVELATNLGAASICVSELLSLRPGDVLKLDRFQNDPLEVCIEGRAKYTGKPFHRNGVFGVEITSGVEEP